MLLCHADMAGIWDALSVYRAVCHADMAGLLTCMLMCHADMAGTRRC